MENKGTVRNCHLVWPHTIKPVASGMWMAPRVLGYYECCTFSVCHLHCCTLHVSTLQCSQRQKTKGDPPTTYDKNTTSTNTCTDPPAHGNNPPTYNNRTRSRNIPRTCIDYLSSVWDLSTCWVLGIRAISHPILSLSLLFPAPPP